MMGHKKSSIHEFADEVPGWGPSEEEKMPWTVLTLDGMVH